MLVLIGVGMVVTIQDIHPKCATQNLRSFFANAPVAKDAKCFAAQAVPHAELLREPVSVANKAVTLGNPA